MMKQSQNQLMTTMSTSRFNLSVSSPSKLSKKWSGTRNIFRSSDFDKSRSISLRTNNNLIDVSRSNSISLIPRLENGIDLYERLHNHAKEKKEKFDLKQNEMLENLKKESIPKIHQTSKKIERKRELFPERLYPYHKLNKMETDEDQSGSFEYAHVATVRSNPLGMSKEFDNDDFRNNIDSIFCDDEEIKNLYGNKPSYVKIYRGIKIPKKEKFSFKPMLSKNTIKIVNNMDSPNKTRKIKKSNSLPFDFYSNNIDQTNNFNSKYSNNNRNNQNNNENCELTLTNFDTSNITIKPIQQQRSNNNLIDINNVSSNNNNDNSNSHLTNFSNNNMSINFHTNIIDSNLKSSKSSYVNVSNINFGGSQNINSEKKPNNNNNNFKNDIFNSYQKQPSNTNNIVFNENGTQKLKKLNYFDNPAERIKNRYQIQLKKSNINNYANMNKNKAGKMNPKSIEISEKLYSQGINMLKKKEKITEEKKKADLEEYKKYIYKPNFQSTNSTTAFVATTNVSSNITNYQSNNNPKTNFTSNNKDKSISKRNSRYACSNNEEKSDKASVSPSYTSNNNGVNINNNYNTSNIVSNRGPPGFYFANQYTSNHSNIDLKNISNFNKINNDISNLNMNDMSNSINVTHNTNNSIYLINNSLLKSNLNNSNNGSETKNKIKDQSNLNFLSNDNYSKPAYSSKIKPKSINKNNQNISTKFKDFKELNKIPTNKTFFDKCQKWKITKDSKMSKLREQKNTAEMKKCTFSPNISPQKISKKKFQDRFSNSSNSKIENDKFFQENNYIKRRLNSINNQEQEKVLQSKLYGENVKNIKMKITQPREFNFSQLISRKSRENFNKARILHKAESVKDYREKLSTKIFFNQAVFEIEEQMDNVNISNLANNNIPCCNIPKQKDSNNANNPSLNKNMNINFNVNIMMKK